MKDAWVYITGTVAAVIGFLWYFLSLKNREVNKLKTKIKLVDTERESDIIESEIRSIRDEKKRTSKEITEINKALDSLEEKRKNIKKEVKSKNNTEIEEYWNK